MKITDPDTIQACQKMAALLDDGYDLGVAWKILSAELPPAVQLAVGLNISEKIKADDLDFSFGSDDVIEAIKLIANGG